MNEKIADLRYHNVIVNRAMDMHIIEGKDYAYCLELAVVALCEQNSILTDEIAKRPNPLLARSNY